MSQSSKLSKYTLLFSTFMLAACAGNATPKNLGTDKEMYEQALQDIGHDNKAAIEKLELLELNYPKSAELPDAMLLKLYAYYSNKQFDEAVMQADKFIKLYPNSPRTPYAYYMKGMANYGRMEKVNLDQQATSDAMQTFRELKERFPDSEYTKASCDMMDHTENMIAAKEMDIGRFYAKRQQYGAAANRFNTVMQRHQHTVVAPEAIYRMVEIHRNMNMPENADRYMSILQQKHPNDIWTHRARRIRSYTTPRGNQDSVRVNGYNVPTLEVPQ